MPAVTVYLSSSAGQPAHVEAVESLARELASRGLTLIYGGAHRGLMGKLADAALVAGAKVVGVIPQALVDLEVAHRGLSELHVVDNMHQRKAMLFDLADAFVVCPGGFGTLEEAFEVLVGIQIGYHNKPVVFLEIDGFWAPMTVFLDHAVASGVLLPDIRALFRTAPTAATALDAVGT